MARRIRPDATGPRGARGRCVRHRDVPPRSGAAHCRPGAARGARRISGAGSERRTEALHHPVSGRTRAPGTSREAPGVGALKVCRGRFAVSSQSRTEMRDLTDAVREAIRGLGITDGLALVNTQHTTCALFVNEYQGALLG